MQLRYLNWLFENIYTNFIELFLKDMFIVYFDFIKAIIMIIFLFIKLQNMF